MPQQEKDFLARCLQLDEREGSYDWPGDWSGNLTLFFKEVRRRRSGGREEQSDDAL